MMMKTVHRILGGIAGGFAGAIIYVLCLLFISGLHFSSLAGLLCLPLPGLITGAILGAIYPKPFMWVAGFILNLFPQ